DVINKSEASYLEIRTGLRSFDESKNYQPYLDSFVQALRESPKAVKGYLSVDRFKSEHDKNYINFIIDAALKNSDVIAGIDISGFSPHAPRMLEGEFLSQTIEKILQHNLCLTIHMGETQSQEEYRDSTTVLSSLQKLFEKNSLYRQKVRLGHVIFLTDEQVGILLELRVPCEFCPSSFIFLTKNIEFDHKKHPLKKIFKEGVSVLLGTDDTLIFQTSFKEEQNKFKQFFILGEPMH
ncbi:MAG: amidohydrolase family protein, partial [Myxococcales bacterium]|nr:amidohydrolase family protein [Myxococcales bacterium]